MGRFDVGGADWMLELLKEVDDDTDEAIRGGFEIGGANVVDRKGDGEGEDLVEER